MSKKVTKVGLPKEEFDQKDLDKLLYDWFREANGLLKEINGSLEEINALKKKTNKFNDNSKKKSGHKKFIIRYIDENS